MFAPVLAAIDASDHATLVLLAITGGFFVLQVIDKGTAVWKRFKADPTPAELYATKDELRAMELRIEKRIGEHLGAIQAKIASTEAKISNMERTLTSFVEEISRSIGRLEGAAGTSPTGKKG